MMRRNNYTVSISTFTPFDRLCATKLSFTVKPKMN